ncbi:unnamed protein product [Prunus armeniaca]
MCGRYGHKREHCDVQDVTPVEKTGARSNMGNDGLVGDQRRPKGVTQEVGGKEGRNTGSRFDALR